MGSSIFFGMFGFRDDPVIGMEFLHERDIVAFWKNSKSDMTRVGQYGIISCPTSQ